MKQQTVIVFYDGNPKNCPLGEFVRTQDIGANESYPNWHMLKHEPPGATWKEPPKGFRRFEHIIFERVFTYRGIVWKRTQ